MYGNKDEIEDDKERIVMFSTQEAMDFLGNCDIMFMDGTVDSSPALFNQVYTIHGRNLSCSFE